MWFLVLLLPILVCMYGFGHVQIYDIPLRCPCMHVWIWRCMLSKNSIIFWNNLYATCTQFRPDLTKWCSYWQHHHEIVKVGILHTKYILYNKLESVVIDISGSCSLCSGSRLPNQWILSRCSQQSHGLRAWQSCVHQQQVHVLYSQ